MARGSQTNTPPELPKRSSKDYDQKFSHSRESRNSREYDEEMYSEKHGYNPRYAPRYDRELTRGGGGGCCSLPKLIVFLIFLGGGLAAFFGLVDLKTFQTWFNNPPGGGDSSDPSTDDQPLTPPYQFIQCPDGGECCNGLESNCDLRVNEMLYATVHNANHDDLLINNHDAPFEGSLERGYRGLMFDVCKCDDGSGNMEIVFCHTACGIGPRDPTEVFTNVDKFLDDNPTEFIIFNFEMSRGDNPPKQSELWDLMKPIDGFKRKTYNHVGDVWPTARELIELDKRIILFQHNGWYLCHEGDEVDCAPRIENFFEYAVENDWSYRDVQSISDSSTSCPGTRGLNGNKQFYSLNNFVTTLIGPSKSSADIINQKEYVLKRLDDCKKTTGYDANFVNIDFWQRGDVPEVAQIVNAERARRRKRYLNRFLRWIQG